MKRLAFLALLAGIVLVATGGTRAPGPVYNADCTWRNNGQIITNPDGTRMECHCTFEEAIDEWWCTWADLQAKTRPNKYRPRHKFRESRYYDHPRVGAWLPGAWIR